MNIHEYQAKNLLKRYGFLIPHARIAMNVEEVEQAVEELGLQGGVAKIQVHAGGRGKAGGVAIAQNPEELIRLASQMLGMRLTNEQTGPQGLVVEKILITELVSIQKEYYLAALIDRARGCPIIMISPEGGMEIEELAAKSPEKILKVPMGLNGKLHNYHLFEIAKFMKWEGEIRKQGIERIAQLAQCFTENDATLIEINPFVLTKNRELLALDAKMTVDDNALFRQPAIAQWYDPAQYSPNDALAKQYDLAYIGLSGNIGCLVNGAGLAMATMDIIQQYGGAPANFLDIGGSATKEEIAHGFKIILMDPNVKSIFVNIFGGIMDCEVLANGIIAASKEDQVSVPLVVRMEGTNESKGKELLKQSGLSILTADTMADGAKLAVEAQRK